MHKVRDIATWLLESSGGEKTEGPSTQTGTAEDRPWGLQQGRDVAGEPSGTVPRSESNEGGILSPVHVTRRLPGRVSVLAEGSPGERIPRRERGSSDGEEPSEPTRDPESCVTRLRGPDLCRVKCHLPVSHIFCSL